MLLPLDQLQLMSSDYCLDVLIPTIPTMPQSPPRLWTHSCGGCLPGPQFPRHNVSSQCQPPPRWVTCGRPCAWNLSGTAASWRRTARCDRIDRYFVRIRWLTERSEGHGFSKWSKCWGKETWKPSFHILGNRMFSEWSWPKPESSSSQCYDIKKYRWTASDSTGRVTTILDTHAAYVCPDMKATKGHRRPQKATEGHKVSGLARGVRSRLLGCPAYSRTAQLLLQSVAVPALVPSIRVRISRVCTRPLPTELPAWLTRSFKAMRECSLATIPSRVSVGCEVPEETAFTTVVRISGAGRNPENMVGASGASVAQQSDPMTSPIAIRMTWPGFLIRSLRGIPSVSKTYQGSPRADPCWNQSKIQGAFKRPSWPSSCSRNFDRLDWGLVTLRMHENAGFNLHMLWMDLRWFWWCRAVRTMLPMVSTSGSRWSVSVSVCQCGNVWRSGTTWHDTDLTWGDLDFRTQWIGHRPEALGVRPVGEGASFSLVRRCPDSWCLHVKENLWQTGGHTVENSWKLGVWNQLIGDVHELGGTFVSACQSLPWTASPLKSIIESQTVADSQKVGAIAAIACRRQHRQIPMTRHFVWLWATFSGPWWFGEVPDSGAALSLCSKMLKKTCLSQTSQAVKDSEGPFPFTFGQAAEDAREAWRRDMPRPAATIAVSCGAAVSCIVFVEWWAFANLCHSPSLTKAVQRCSKHCHRMPQA